MDKAYLDTSTAINNRIISIFPTNKPAINGESWFLSGNKKRQAFRQVYTFAATTNIPHGITVTDKVQFVRCFGTYTDGTDSFGLLYGTSVAVAGLISFYITSTDIVFMVGAGSPALTSGVIVLEWLSSP